MVIDKVVHRIWFGPEPMRQELHDYADAWKRFGYTVEHWTETNLPPLQNQQIYDEIDMPETGCAPARLGKWTQRADLASYELVYQFGGIYANCDIEPLRDLTPLLADVECFAGWELQDEVACNALFGATPGHPFWKRVIEALPAQYQAETAMQRQTGPWLLTYVADQHPDEIRLFDQAVFYPYAFTEMDREHDRFPDAYTSHHWGHTRG